jgi:hypothetical protein
LKDAADFPTGQQAHVTVQQAAKSLADTVDFDTVFQPGPHNRPDGRIHPRRISAACHDGNPFQ